MKMTTINDRIEYIKEIINEIDTNDVYENGEHTALKFELKWLEEFKEYIIENSDINYENGDVYITIDEIIGEDKNEDR